MKKDITNREDIQKLVHSLLAQVLAKEDYESASKIRDAIAQKNK